MSCTEHNNDQTLLEDDNPQITQEMLIEANRNLTKDQAFKIDQFCKHHNWPVVETGTGIRYYIYESGKGKIAKPGTWALIDYEVRLLDSDTTLCYSSKEKGPIEFLVEMYNIESGLHEAITYMHVGDKAFIILPHYLAHGLVGNLDKIPSFASVLYKIHLLDVQEK